MAWSLELNACQGRSGRVRSDCGKFMRMPKAIAEETETQVELREWRRVIEAALHAYTELDAGCPPLLQQAIRYSLLGPGKRLRPLLVLASCRMCGGQWGEALPAACAVEMIHAYSLVHDDLPGMDDDDLRRGRPTCHVQFNHATAILVGDSLQSLAFQILAEAADPRRSPTVTLEREPAPGLSDAGPSDAGLSALGGSSASGAVWTPAVAVGCVAALARAAGPSGMAGGQQDDLMAECLPPTEETLEGIHLRKTGALLAVSLEMGGIVAQATPVQLEKLRRVGQNMGLAFQITDDLLDVTGDADRVGKSTGKDQGQGKLTYPGLFGVAASRQKAQDLIRRAEDDLQSFGPLAQPLRVLARFVLERHQ